MTLEPDLRKNQPKCDRLGCSSWGPWYKEKNPHTGEYMLICWKCNKAIAEWDTKIREGHSKLNEVKCYGAEL